MKNDCRTRVHALLVYRALRCVIGRGATLVKRQERRGPACIWQKDQTGVSEKRKTMRSSLVARRELGYSLLAVSPRVARSQYWSSDRFGGLFRAFPKTTGERTKRARWEEGKGTDRQNRIDTRDRNAGEAAAPFICAAVSGTGGGRFGPTATKEASPSHDHDDGSQRSR